MIQIDIDMPKQCEECPLCVDYDCIIHERITDEYYDTLAEQYAHCPLNLPSAQPERMRGKWVNYGEGECCDQCGRYPYDDGEFHILGWRSNFCPHCGADMREDRDE